MSGTPAFWNRTEVDMMELICGISLLCHGSEAGAKGGRLGTRQDERCRMLGQRACLLLQDDKIHAVFGIFDENGDGYISLDEMYKFLTSVFKAGSIPQHIKTLATVTTHRVACDLLSNDLLSRLTSPRLNPQKGGRVVRASMRSGQIP